MPGWPFSLLYSEGSNCAHLSERLANRIMISKEHWKIDQILFQNVYGHRETVNLRDWVLGVFITYRFCSLPLHGIVNVM